MRWILCRNPVEADRDAARRTDALTPLYAQPERITTAPARDAERCKVGKKSPSEHVHLKAEDALRDHPNRWPVAVAAAVGPARLDKTKIAAEERLDGKYLRSTSDAGLRRSKLQLSRHPAVTLTSSAGTVAQTDLWWANKSAVPWPSGSSLTRKVPP